MLIHADALKGVRISSDNVPAHARALNHARIDDLDLRHVTAFCRELPATVPDSLELVPAGKFAGVDGRSWINDQPDAIIAAFNRDGLKLPIDYEHATEVAAPEGREAPAAGWITALENRGGAIFGKVEWTERGKNMVGAKEYRYYSPAFDFARDSRRVLKLVSTGLTNKPNLPHFALNHQHPQEDVTVKIALAILSALGITNADASEGDVVNAISTLKSDKEKALNAQQNTVPKEEHQKALNRADKAETELAALKQETVNSEIERELDVAQKAGKITPATREYHQAVCKQEKGLDKFRAWCKTAPVIGDGTGLDNKKPGEGGSGSSFKAPDGYQVDPERLALHEKALNYQKQHPNTTYEAAVRAVA